MSEEHEGPSLPGDLEWKGALDLLHEQGLEAGRRALELALVTFPEHPEMHYDLAFALAELGDRRGMVSHLLTVLRLDEAHDRRSGLENDDDLEFISMHAERVLAAIPQEFRDRMGPVPVVLEARPSAGLVEEEAFDPRAYGLFQGIAAPFSADFEFKAVEPTRIVLYWANLLADFQEDEQLIEQIEITILHEVGHFFGLDEDQVDELGLA